VELNVITWQISSREGALKKLHNSSSISTKIEKKHSFIKHNVLNDNI
jgi:hypothetical protein